jgi:hypothetical protein
VKVLAIEEPGARRAPPPPPASALGIDSSVLELLEGD